MHSFRAPFLLVGGVSTSKFDYSPLKKMCTDFTFILSSPIPPPPEKKRKLREFLPKPPEPTGNPVIHIKA